MTEDKNLSRNQLQELKTLEETIEQGIKTFVEVGSALARIRDERLYRENYETFEAYCKERWGMAIRTAYQYIDSAKVFENVRNCAQIPTHESQTRPLSSLPPDEQKEAWEEAVATAPEGKVTGAHVAKIVKKTKNNSSPEELKNQKKQKKKNPELISGNFEGAYDDLVDVIKEEKKSGWKTTSRESALEYVNKLVALINKE